MERRQTIFFNHLTMVQCPVPFVLAKVKSREFSVELVHEAISRDLCDN